MILETKRLSLRPFQCSDLDTLFSKARRLVRETRECSTGILPVWPLGVSPGELMVRNPAASTPGKVPHGPTGGTPVLPRRGIKGFSTDLFSYNKVYAGR